MLVDGEFSTQATIETCALESPEIAAAPAGATDAFAPMGNCSIARSVARDAARVGGATAAPDASAPVGSRCKCGGIVLAGGECTNCMTRRMRAEGAPEEEVGSAVLARMELSGLEVSRRFDDADAGVSVGLAQAVRDRRVARAGARAITPAPGRLAARNPLDWLEEGAQWAGDRVDDVADAAGDAADWVGDRAEDVSEAAGDAADWVGDRAHDVGDAAGEAGDWVADQTGQEWARDAGDWVREGADEVSDTAHDAGDWVSDRADDVSDAADRAADWVGDAADWVRDVIPGGGRVRARRKIRAQAICKCVGDDACGGGKIHKKYFHVEDCKDAKLEAEKICNNDPEMIEKCTRPKCYYRHGDYKCPA